MNNITSVDKQFTIFLHLIPHFQYLDTFFNFFSQVGYFSYIWILIVLLLSVYLSKKNKIIIPTIIISLIIAFGSTYTFKHTFKRPRPVSFLNTKLCPHNFLADKKIIIPEECNPHDYSFPSGHATYAFMFATLFAFFDKKRRYIYYLIAILIAYSRIYIGVHYLSDIIAGGLLGFTISTVILNFVNRKDIRNYFRNKRG